MSLPPYTICEPCGAVIHDRTVHARFHARLNRQFPAPVSGREPDTEPGHVDPPTPTPPEDPAP